MVLIDILINVRTTTSLMSKVHDCLWSKTITHVSRSEGQRASNLRNFKIVGEQLLPIWPRKCRILFYDASFVLSTNLRFFQMIYYLYVKNKGWLTLRPLKFNSSMIQQQLKKLLMPFNFIYFIFFLFTSIKVI